MRFIFVNRFYWPEEPATGQLLTDLAEALASAGHDVNVITSRPWATLPGTEVRNGVHIRRVRGTRWSRAGIAGKAFDHLVCYASIVAALLCKIRGGDVVVALTDPPMLGVGAWLAARLRGAAIVHWVQDVYPEIAIALSGQSWLRILCPLRDVSWRRADACVAVGADMATLISDAGVAADRLHVIPNRAPAGVAVDDISAPGLRSEWGAEGKFIVAYSGNLGRVHDLEPIIDVAAELREHRRIVFVFIGDGPQRPRLELLARSLALSNVEFRPAQPRARLNDTLAVADVHLVTLRAGCERLVFPSKLSGVIAAGRPVLFLGPAASEPARLVRDHGLGFGFERHQGAELAETVKRLASTPGACAELSANVRAFAQRDSKENWTARWNAVFASVARGGASRGTPVPGRAR